jgi:hypothetical protein
MLEIESFWALFFFFRIFWRVGITSAFFVYINKILLAWSNSFLEVMQASFKMLDVCVLHDQTKLLFMHKMVNISAFFDQPGS